MKCESKGLVLESHNKVAGKNMVLVEDKNQRMELEKMCRKQITSCFLSIEIGYIELFSSVAPKSSWFDRKRLTGMFEFIKEKTLVITAH